MSGDPPVGEEHPSAVLREALERFSSRTQSRLISARASGADSAAQGALLAAGFLPVEFSIEAYSQQLRPEALPARRFPFRLANIEDQSAILRIASSAFTFGRYHGDPRFPRNLADRRYVTWVRNALNGENQNDHVFVLGGPDSVLGFMNVVIRDTHADMRLGAVDPDNEVGFAGYALYVETLRAVHSLGAHSISARIAAANTRVVNIFAGLGCRFRDPEMVLHWHPRNVTCLLPSITCREERLPA